MSFIVMLSGKRISMKTIIAALVATATLAAVTVPSVASAMPGHHHHKVCSIHHHRKVCR